MGDEYVCNTKLSLGINFEKPMPESSNQEKNKRALPLDLSFGNEGQSSGNSNDVANGIEVKKKCRLSKEQTIVLEESFKKCTSLNSEHKNELAEMLDLKPRQVEVWFQNRRARTKLKQTETECEQLKRNYEDLYVENLKLKKEIEDLKAFVNNQREAFYAQLKNGMANSVCTACKKLEGVPQGSGDARIEKAIAASSVDVIKNPRNTKRGLKVRG